MKKKAILLILSAVLAGNITSCQRVTDPLPGTAAARSAEAVDPETADTEKDQNSEKTETEKTAASADADTKAGETKSAAESADGGTADPQTGKEQEHAFEPVTVTEGDCVMTFCEVDPEDVSGYTIRAVFKNNSAETTYMFAVESAYTNGLNAEPFFAAAVSPGKETSSDIRLPESTAGYLEDTITEIELHVKIYNTDHYEEKAFEDTVTLYPKGKEAASVYRRRSESTDQVLVDNEFVRVTYVGSCKDEIWDYGMILYLENKTSDKTVMYSIENCALNDVMIDPFWSAALHPGKSGYSEVAFDLDELEDNGIAEVSSAAFSLEVCDYGGMSEGEGCLSADAVRFTP